jgi:hypothetical protein
MGKKVTFEKWGQCGEKRGLHDRVAVHEPSQSSCVIIIQAPASKW